MRRLIREPQATRSPSGPWCVMLHAFCLLVVWLGANGVHALGAEAEEGCEDQRNGSMPPCSEGMNHDRANETKLYVRHTRTTKEGAVEFTVWCPTKTLAGEGGYIVAELCNRAEEQIRRNSESPVFWITVRDGRGNEVDTTLHGVLYELEKETEINGIRGAFLAPGERLQKTYNIGRLFDLSRTGVYRMKIHTFAGRERLTMDSIPLRVSEPEPGGSPSSRKTLSEEEYLARLAAEYRAGLILEEEAGDLSPEEYLARLAAKYRAGLIQEEEAYDLSPEAAQAQAALLMLAPDRALEVVRPVLLTEDHPVEVKRRCVRVIASGVWSRYAAGARDDILFQALELNGLALDAVRGLAEHGEDLQGRTTEEQGRLRKAFLAGAKTQIPLDAAKALRQQEIVSTQTYADWCRACATDQTVEEELRFHCARELARVEDLGEAEWRRIRESIPGYDDIKRWEDR